jgi:hypothetical protein
VRTRWVLPVALGIPLGLIGLFVFVMLFYDGRQDIDLDRWVGPQEGGYGGEMMPNARWATDELCGDDLPCIQAVTSDTLTMYRFARREHAVDAAESFGADGYLTGWIAVRYEPGALSESERYDFEYVISCINTWVGEEGQDC